MDKKSYDIQYAREKLKRVPLDLTHDDYNIVQKAAEAAGESINGYIKKSITTRMLQDCDRQPDSEWVKDIQSHSTVSNKSTIINMFNEVLDTYRNIDKHSSEG